MKDKEKFSDPVIYFDESASLEDIKEALKAQHEVSDAQLLEELSDLEHEQWIYWSQMVAKDIKSYILELESCSDMYPVQRVLNLLEEKLEKWEKSWIPYSELTDEVQEFDRVWARKVIKTLDNEE